MNTSRTSLSSELQNADALSPGHLAYLRERFRARLYDLIVTEFLRRSKEGLTKKGLAKRIGKRPEQITRYLASPGNWTLDTISDLLAGMSAAELHLSLSSLLDRPKKNYRVPDWAVANDTSSFYNHNVKGSDYTVYATISTGDAQTFINVSSTNSLSAFEQVPEVAAPRDAKVIA